ncbi:SRPBCC family protein [Streptomyces sp. NPDC058294]|uniref:SRPBCC family protein n=1 Tax=Streptomyces sp. NPDC058294 TaxID=3346430 RepID=UPI0036E842F1
MEYGSISREISIEATPEVVYDVISRPEHLREWWPDEAELATSTPGSTGTVRFGHGRRPRSKC